MEPTDANRRAFDDAHRRWARDRLGLPPIVARTLGDLTGKRVLHLHCATGEAAAELAELGAVVTGVDRSDAALETARERWPRILWVHGEAQALLPELRRGRFDLVYSADGVLASLDDVDAWADGIADALDDRGELLMFDEHPVARCVDGLLHWYVDYFEEGLWRLGRIVTSLARVGFHVEALEEYPGTASRRRIPASFLLYARRAG
jgi:SAM-dependent methyltransferase